MIYGIGVDLIEIDRIKQAIERNGQRGDLIVEVDVTVPPHLSEEQERLMKDFAEAGGLKY